MQGSAVEQRLQRIVSLTHRGRHRGGCVVPGSERLVGRGGHPIRLVVEHHEPRLGAGHSQDHVDRAGQEPGQHALGSGRASQLGAVAVQRVSAGQVGFEQGSQVGDPPTTIGRAERQLEVEFGEPVLRAKFAQRPAVGERAKRSGQGLHQSIRQRHGVEPGERESCCLPGQLPAQRPGKITIGGIDTLQHRMYQAAELRAARQWG